MPPAARVSDLHVCPLTTEGGTPHVGGPITGPGAATVLIGGLPAARANDLAACAGTPDRLIPGSATVLIATAATRILPCAFNRAIPSAQSKRFRASRRGLCNW